MKPSKPRRFRRLRLARVPFLSLLLLLVVALGLAVIFDRPLLKRFVLPRIETLAGEALGLEVRIGAADLDPGGGLDIEDLSAAGPEPKTGIRSLAAERIHVALSFRG